MEKSSMFEKLASSLTYQERQKLLEKIATISDTAVQLSPHQQDELDSYEDLTLKFQNESFLFKFFLHIKSFFQSIKIENLYNDYLISKKAKEIEKNYPDVLDYKHGFILSTFYTKLKELKRTANFFKPAIASYEDNQGDFFVFLASLMLPDTFQHIDNEANPYNFSFDILINNDTKTNLTRKLEEILQSIPSNEKNRLYAAIQSVEWIKHFVKLPYDKILTRYISIVKGTYTCPIDSVSTELAQFAKVLSNGKKIFPEVLETLFLFSQNAVSNVDEGSINDLTNKYINKSVEQISIIKMFIYTIPIKSLAAVAARSSTFVLEKYDGIEEWYVKFKTHMRRLLDKKWELWLKDKRKYLTKNRVNNLLSTAEYPLLPTRPWTEIWGGDVTFSKELSMGFLFSFFAIKYPIYANYLKILSIEGDFNDRDLRVEFTDSFNSLNHLSQEFIEFDINLCERGLYGSSFDTITKESIRTIQGQTKVDSLMLTIESESSALIAKFCNALRTLITILSSILTDETDSHYAPLLNIATIQGKMNSLYKRNLSSTLQDFIETIDIIKEIETIEITEK